MNRTGTSLSLLDAIRRKEAEAKRHLAAEREAAEARLAAVKQQAHELITLARTEGHRAGEAQRQAARAQAEREAAEIIARARKDAETLRTAGETLLEAAVTRAVKLVIGGAHET